MVHKIECGPGAGIQWGWCYIIFYTQKQQYLMIAAIDINGLSIDICCIVIWKKGVMTRIYHREKYEKIDLSYG